MTVRAGSVMTTPVRAGAGLSRGKSVPTPPGDQDEVRWSDHAVRGGFGVICLGGTALAAGGLFAAALQASPIAPAFLLLPATYLVLKAARYGFDSGGRHLTRVMGRSFAQSDLPGTDAGTKARLGKDLAGSAVLLSAAAIGAVACPVSHLLGAGLGLATLSGFAFLSRLAERATGFTD